MKTSYIDGIKSIEDFRRIPENELDDLAAEIREFLVRSVSKTGGHLASNLGVVELTIALQRAFIRQRIRSYPTWATKPMSTKY